MSNVTSQSRNTFRVPALAAGALALAYLWFHLINQLRIEWSLNPQYNYGWAVPFLCVYLLWLRVRQARAARGSQDIRPLSGVFRPPWSRLALACCALIYAPARLVEEANPDWRLVSWLLAVVVVMVTLLVANEASRHSQSSIINPRILAFPVCYFLVAVPWPSIVELPLIQALTRFNAGTTVELLTLFGVPAMRHGNVIEIATGVVGIDEACSGIRSFQATLMISLFMGELYRLGVARRVLLCLAGFALSLLFNVARTTLLVWVASSKGIPAIASWHDPGGITILVACFCCVWWIGHWFSTTGGAAQTLDQTSRDPERSREGGTPSQMLQLPPRFAFGLAAWVALTEAGVEWWYRSHEKRAPTAVQWTVAWPTNAASFKQLPIPDVARQILRFDSGQSVAWMESDGTRWQAFSLQWEPGRTALHLARNHTPQVCLAAAGKDVVSESTLKWFPAGGLRMPFRGYEIGDATGTFYVFYCLWTDAGTEQGFETAGLTWGSRLAPVLAGVRNPGQRSFEIAIWGLLDAASAEAAVKRKLEELIVPTGINRGAH
ncbi:MAG TPA: exosortase/archaeosortase family protein [Verrucomicrobiota bacterium]|nr:exosortase/archaeosortase family protein [Verrucomicrobiota bacterium]